MIGAHLNEPVRGLHTTQSQYQSPHHHRSTSSSTATTTTAPAGPGPRLSVVRPDLASEWAAELNEDIDVSHVECNSSRAVWWRCSSCGSEFKSTVVERVESEKGCPDCAGSFAGLQAEGVQTKDAVGGDGATSNDAATTHAVGGSASSLAATHPQLVVFWHPTKNGILRPQDVTSDSHAVIWWVASSSASAAASSSATTTTPTTEEFQQSVAQFAMDPRSPMQKAADQVAVETSVIRQISEVARAPHVPQADPKYTFTMEDSLATLAHLHITSRKLPRSDPVVSPNTNTDRVLFQRQPRRSTEEALRTKALSYFVNRVMEGKSGGRQDASATTSIELTEASIRNALGQDMPSYAFVSGSEETEAVEWKRYFSLAPHEAELAWTLKRTSADPPPPATLAGNSAQGSATTPSSSASDSSSSSSSQSEKEAYPAKPDTYSIPAEHPDDRTLSPRRVQRRRPHHASASEHSLRQRDEDGGRESFGKYDDRLLDENDAMSMYDAAAPVTMGDDDASATPELSLQDQQYQRQQQGRRPVARRPRRAFEMKLPSELGDGPKVSTPTAPPAAPPAPVLPHAPRVVARSKRRSLTTDE